MLQDAPPAELCGVQAPKGSSSAVAKSRGKKYLLPPEMGEIPGESSQRSKRFWNAASKPALKMLYTFL